MLQADYSTASETAVRLLMRDVVAGALLPGSKLKLRELIARYDLGASPIREALAQLSGKGFVEFEGNKGFRVAVVSQEQLADITQSRQIVEGEALRLAIENGSSAWEDEIVTSFTLLQREVDRRDSDSAAWLDAYERCHHRFHRSLIAACPLTELTRFCDHLYMQKTRYRRFLKRAGFTNESRDTQHRSLMKRVLARDTEAALRTLKSHIGVTASELFRHLNAPKGSVRFNMKAKSHA